MQLSSPKIQRKHLTGHETKKEALSRFVLVLLVFAGYFGFVSVKYGASQGFLIAWLTWSAFVLGTPIADAGFLVDFPIRILTGLRMLYSELLVWTIAISLNIYVYFFRPDVYTGHTLLLKVFHQILSHPVPYWSIILISAIGTFASVHFGDELLDKRHHHERVSYHKHKSKYKLVLMIALFVSVLIVYNILIHKLGIEF